MYNTHKAVTALFVAMTMGLGVPCVGFAEEQAAAQTETQAGAPATLDEAWTKYGELSMQVAEVGESLNDTYYKLDQATAQKASLGEQIAASTQRLEDARAALGDRVSSNYKVGSSSMLDIILSINSIEDLVSTLHYIDKITQADIDCVNEVRAASEELEKQNAALIETESQLQELASQKEQQLTDLQKSLEEQQGYIAGLSEPLRAAFDEKQVAEIVAQQAAAVQALATQEAALANGTASAAAATATDTNATTDGAAVADAVTTIAQETAAATSSGSGSSLSSDARAKILEAAYSQLGVTYQYGASSPGEAFDCSGFTSWAYSQAGIDIPHSSVAQADMATTVSADELQPGDLVFYIGNVDASQSGSHVAIYAGDGQVIHANGSVVTTSALNENYTSVGTIV